jgi:hypothetical protein
MINIMFNILVIKPNVFGDFEKSLWQEKEKVKGFFTSVTTDNLQEALSDVYNPDHSKDKLDLNTLDVLFTRQYTYQLVYGIEDETENYIGSVINYKRKPVKGTCVLIKIKLSENNNKIEYQEAPITIDDDIEFIIKDLFFHTGYKINSTLQEFTYDNKYSVLEDDNMKELNNHEVNLFGIPFRIWYKEGKLEKTSTTLSYVRDIGIFLNKNITEIYITCSVYNQCKCLSMDKELIKQFIDLVTTYPDEGELKEISVAYNFATKNHRSDNVYVMFSDFYWKVMKESK